MTVDETIDTVNKLLKDKTIQLDTTYKKVIKTLLSEYETHHHRYRKTCLICGKRYIAKKSTSMYCSHNCTNKAWMNHVKADPERLAKRKEVVKKCNENYKPKRIMRKKQLELEREKKELEKKAAAKKKRELNKKKKDFLKYLEKVRARENKYF